jgi:hypothetical protein
MEKKIIVKEIDTYSSKLFKGKTISEYLIYVALEDGAKISATIVYGNDAKIDKVNELLVEHFLVNSYKLNPQEVVEELTFQKTKKQNG